MDLRSGNRYTAETFDRSNLAPPQHIELTRAQKAGSGIGVSKHRVKLGSRPPHRPFPMAPRIWCALTNDGVIFPIDIEWTLAVADLKQAIKERRQLASAADDLTLYRAEVEQDLDGTREKRIAELRRLSENLNECKLLEDEQQMISECFDEEKKYYTLVRLPEGELIYGYCYW